MAARLNTPADFLVPNQAGTPAAGSKQYGLLPPSMFETTSSRPTPSKTEPTEPWRDLAKLTAEILILRNENQKLRDKKEVIIQTAEPIKAHVDLHQSTPLPPASGFNLSHVDQIIQRQAAEIASLQQKLSQTQGEHQKAEAQWESQTTLCEARHEQQLTTLQSELASQRESLNQKLQQKESELLACQAERQRQVSDLEATLHNVQTKTKEETQLLEEVLSDRQGQLDKATRELEDTKRHKAAELEAVQQQLTQLKTYVAETETLHKSSDTWKRELENLSSKLRIREEEVTQLNQQVALANTRLQAQDRILTLQEQHLSKVKDESLDKKKNVLLTRWREKVYVLMVQLKSAEITSKHQEHNWDMKLQEKTDKLQSVEAELSVQMAAVEDRDAQLKMSKHQIMTLETELTRAQDLAISLDDQTHHHTNLIRQLAQFTHNLYQKYSETLQQLASVTAALKAYDQRISFASGRICMLQSQFSRKEALLKMKYEEQPTKDTDPVPEVGPSELEALGSELQRVTEERDALVRQQQEDARLLESKVTAAKLKVEGEVKELKDNTERLHQHIDEKNQLVDELTEQLEGLRGELHSAQTELLAVTQQAATAREELHKEMEGQVEEEHAKCTETLAQMEHRLNECRREQTKAVVSLRQLERANTRDKERAAERLAAVENEYKERISQLEKKFHTADKDRNILMTTLRQEGLVGQQKAQRLPPVHSELIHEGEPADTKSALPLPTISDSEPLHDVIDDLKSLTAEVMEDGDDES